MSSSTALFTEVSLTSSYKKNLVGLPTDFNRVLRAQQLHSDDFTVFDNHELDSPASSGGFFSLQGGSQFSAFCYTVSESKDILTLTPTHVVDESKLNYKSLCFKFPEAISFNCVSFNEVNDQIILDVLLNSGLLVTLVFDFDSFTENCFLNKNNVYKWCRYIIPTSLGKRRPLLLKSLDSLTSVISLSDGGLLLLSRSSPFDPFSDKLFTSSSYLESWSFFKKPWSKKSTISQNAEFDGQIVNTNSVIDILPFNSGAFVTLSVDKILTFWSKDSQSVIKKYDMNEFLPNDLHSAILSPSLPHSFLKIVDNILSVFLPIDRAFVYLLDLDLDFNITLMKTIEPPIPNNSWLPLDYDVISAIPGVIEYWFAWYFGQSAMYQKCVIDKNGDLTWNEVITKTSIEDLQIQKFIADVNGTDDIDMLSKKTMRFLEAKYTNDTLSISIDFFSSEYNLDLESLNLNEKLELIMNNPERDISSLRRQILRFASACQDIQTKSSDNLLSLFVSKHCRNQFAYILKSKGFSIIRRSTPFELLLFNATKSNPSFIDTSLVSGDINVDDLLTLVNLILDFSSGFSTEIQYRIHQKLINSNSQSIEQTMNDIFNSDIVNTVNDNVVSNLLNALTNIDNGTLLFEYLTELLTFDPTEYIPIPGTHITSLGDSLLKESIYYSNSSASKILFGLALILLTIDISNPVIELFEKVNHHLRSINFLNNVHTLSSYDFIIKYLKNEFYGGVYFEANNINKVLPILLKSLTNDKFKYYVISNLLSYNKINESSLAKEFLLYLPNNAIGCILQGITILQTKCPVEAKELFISHAEEITQNAFKITEAEKDVLSSVWETFSLLLVPSNSDYYFNLALLFENYKYDQIALLFSMMSLENIESSNKNTIFLHDVLHKVFDLSLKLQEYENAFNAIKQMERTDRFSPLRMFVYNLFQEGQLKRLLDFDFTEDFVAVDELIWDMGEESIGIGKLSDKDMSLAHVKGQEIVDSKLSLKYYRICYALRMKRSDLRGAAEALDRFNSIILSREPKMRGPAVFGLLPFSLETKMVLDNYTIMFNLLRTIEQDDDRWIIKKAINGGRNTLMTYNDLEKECAKLKVLLGVE